MANLQPQSLLTHPEPPRQVSDETFTHVKAACLSRDFNRFRELLSDLPSDNFRIHDLSSVMLEAARLNFSEEASNALALCVGSNLTSIYKCSERFSTQWMEYQRAYQ